MPERRDKLLVASTSAFGQRLGHRHSLDCKRMHAEPERSTDDPSFVSDEHFPHDPTVRQRFTNFLLSARRAEPLFTEQVTNHAAKRSFTRRMSRDLSVPQ